MAVGVQRHPREGGRERSYPGPRFRMESEKSRPNKIEIIASQSLVEEVRESSATESSATESSATGGCKEGRSGRKTNF